MKETDSSTQRLRPLYRGACILFAIAGVIAVALSFIEEPRPWEFQISGSVFALAFGFLGFRGVIPKWIGKQTKG